MNASTTSLGKTHKGKGLETYGSFDARPGGREHNDATQSECIIIITKLWKSQVKKEKEKSILLLALFEAS